MAQQSVLGFPVDRVVPLTAYADVPAITAKLRDDGVEDIAVHYRYWNKGGTGAAIPTGIEPEGRLGGKRAFSSMLDTLEQENTALYLDFNFTDLVRNRFGYQRNTDSVTSVRQNLSLQFSYQINTLKALTSSSYTLLRLPKIRQAAEKTAASAEKYSFTGLLSLIHISSPPMRMRRLSIRRKAMRKSEDFKKSTRPKRRWKNPTWCFIRPTTAPAPPPNPTTPCASGGTPSARAPGVNPACEMCIRDRGRTSSSVVLSS